MKERLVLLEMMAELFRRLGMKNLEVVINSVGCPRCRPVYREALLQHFQARRGELCETCLERMDRNPLRILVERLKVSKSALSTNIHLLLDKELIYYETKEGKRRKYFKSFPFDKRFEGFLGLICYERDFTVRFQQYMKTQNESEHSFTEERIHKLGLFLDYLEQIEALTEDFLKKLKQEEISEKP